MNALEFQDIIETLNDDLKLPFKMAREGFKYLEIAEKPDLNTGTVKIRIFCARMTLIKPISITVYYR